MSAIDWWVLSLTLAAFVLYGLWRSRGERNLTDYLVAGRLMPWPAVALSVMATQASAVTFMSTPGQGYADGLRFVQFYFGLPLAMIVLCVTAVPIYQQLRVFTASSSAWSIPITARWRSRCASRCLSSSSWYSAALGPFASLAVSAGLKNSGGVTNR